MKTEQLKNKLRWAVASAEKVTGKNLSLPALGQVMLEAKGQNLKVKATNLDVGLEITLPGKIESPGSVLINGSVAANFLGNLPTDTKVKLELVSQSLTINASKTSSTIKTYPVDDFPLIPRPEGARRIKVVIPQLIYGLKSVFFAATTSDIKPEIASIYLYQDRGDLVLVATDSFRLAEKKLVLNEKIKEEVSLILPIKNAVELIRVFESIEGEGVVEWNQNQLSIHSDLVYFTSRLVDGVFPDYRQIMPTKNQTIATISKDALGDTLKLANVFSDKLNQVNLRVVASDKLFEINSRNSDVGENTSQLDADITGEDIDISFNVRYLLDCLSAVEVGTISLAFNGKNRPIVARGVGDDTFTYLIMPLNR